MRPLTAADASFLYIENDVVHLHVTGLMTFDPSTFTGDYSFAHVRDHLLERIHLIEPFRRRLIEVPFGIDHPVWIEDPDFDIDAHIHQITLDAPGTPEQLEDFVGDFASIPLDRARPLWDMFVVDGLADGSIALVTKMHHAAVDGVTGADMMAHLLDFTPDPEPLEPPETEWVADNVPGNLEVIAGAMTRRALDPLRSVRALGRTAGSLVSLATDTITGSGGPSMANPFSTPRTSLNGSLSARRSVAMAKASLGDFKIIKTVFGTTVNDVYLAAVTHSLRQYLLAQGEDVSVPLVCSVPVSVHGETSDDASANQVSNMFVHLPIDTGDPAEQLRRVREDTVDAKSAQGAIGADMIGDITELTPPAIFNLASRMYSRAGLADHLPPVQNLIVSNVPGPPIPLYTAGAELTGGFPFGPLMEGAGLNITMLSNMGNMDIGVIGCPDIIADVRMIARGVSDGVDRLLTAAHAV